MRRAIGVLILMLLGCAVLLAFGGCNREEKASYEYERPLDTLALAIKNKDNNSYVRCFAPPIADSYFKSNDGESIAEDVYNAASELVGRSFSVSCRIKDKSELKGEELEELENDVKKGIDIKKAYSLEVVFSLVTMNDTYSCSKTLNVGKIDNGWYICSDVFSDFDFELEEKKQ